MVVVLSAHSGVACISIANYQFDSTELSEFKLMEVVSLLGKQHTIFVCRDFFVIGYFLSMDFRERKTIAAVWQVGQFPVHCSDH